MLDVFYAQGIMLVYDITQDKSFENISKWLRNIEEHANEDVEKMILGNKCDMEDKRVVSKDRGTSVCIIGTEILGLQSCPPPPPLCLDSASIESKSCLVEASPTNGNDMIIFLLC